jgi:hypothetical protein
MNLADLNFTTAIDHCRTVVEYVFDDEGATERRGIKI